MDWTARALRGLGAVVLMAVGVAAARAADTFPTRPIRIIVPTVPGGTLDLTTRMFAQKMSDILGQAVVVDNRPGADTMLGTRMVVEAQPDGYTILAQSEGLVLTPQLRLEKPLDPLKDLAPVGLMVRYGFIMETGGDKPYRNATDFVAAARAQPKDVNYASGGVGTPPHIAAALFLKKAGVDIRHVPYKGNGAALPDVAGGRVDMIFDGFISSSSYLKGNKLRPLGVASAKRIAALPDLPTLIEQGIDYYYPSWLGVLAPAKTPKEVVERLSSALLAAGRDPAVLPRISDMGGEPAPDTPAEFGTVLAKQYDASTQIIADLDLPKQ